MKGIEIARLCNVSTSTLKHYEEWGLVPEVPRAENGYRKYTNIHAAYFQCIVKMNIGFGMKFVREIMPSIQKGEVMQVLWRINEVQTLLQKERHQAEQVVEMLDVEEVEWFQRSRKKKDYYTIGEVAEIAGIAASAIRHWEAGGAYSSYSSSRERVSLVFTSRCQTNPHYSNSFSCRVVIGYC